MSPQGRSQILNAQQATGLDINSIMAGWVDRGTWIYYDTVTQAKSTAAQASYQLFKVPVGQNDQITGVQKTKLQTNLENPGQFAPPRCLILNQLGFMFTGPYSTSSANYVQTTLQDMEAFVNSCYFEMKIDSKIFFEGLLHFHPPGYGVYGSSTGNNEEAFGLGFPSPHATYTFGNFAKYIAPLQNFSLNIIFPMNTLPTWSSGGNGINLVVFMKGLTDRSVQ